MVYIARMCEAQSKMLLVHSLLATLSQLSVYELAPTALASHAAALGHTKGWIPQLNQRNPITDCQ